MLTKHFLQDFQCRPWGVCGYFLEQPNTIYVLIESLSSPYDGLNGRFRYRRSESIWGTFHCNSLPTRRFQTAIKSAFEIICLSNQTGGLFKSRRSYLVTFSSNNKEATKLEPQSITGKSFEGS